MMSMQPLCALQSPQLVTEALTKGSGVCVCARAGVCEISESHKHRAILEALFACRLSAELFLLINIQATNKE